jgi:hypothetical protein
MTDIRLRKDELDLLKQLGAAGPRGRTISGAKNRDGLNRLVKARYVTDRAASAYFITDAGRKALTEATE